MILLSHDRYQYDNQILSKQTWAYHRQHLQQLLWCVFWVRLNLPDVEERKFCPLAYYTNCVSTTLTVLILHNVESVYFFFSKLVLLFSSKWWGDGIITGENLNTKPLQHSPKIAIFVFHSCNFGVSCGIFARMALSWLYILKIFLYS